MNKYSIYFNEKFCSSIEGTKLFCNGGSCNYTSTIMNEDEVVAIVPGNYLIIISKIEE